jgi:hypothetical protein
MSRKPEMMRNPEVECHQYDPWRDLALEAELDAMIADVIRRQKEASARYSAVATGMPPLPNLRSTPAASSPAALPVDRTAEYLHSDPNGPEIQLASMIVDQQFEAEAAVAAAARMKADEERAAVSAAAPDSPIHDCSDEALDAQIRSEINARQFEEDAIIRQRAIAVQRPPRPVMNPDPQQFVKFPVNVLEWRRHLSATKWTVLSVIHDKIARWDKESDAVSNSQIAAETTLSESSIRRAIAEMNTSDGPLEVTARGTRGIPVYRIRPCDRYQSDTPVNQSVAETQQGGPSVGPESGGETMSNPLPSEKKAQAALTAVAKLDSLTAATDKRDAAVLDALEKLGMGSGGNGKYTLVELGTHLNCPMTNLQNLCAHLASMSSRGRIHHESGTGLYCSMAAPRMPAVAVETQEVAPNASELLESPTAVEAPATSAPAAELSLQNRILAAIDSEPKNFSQLSATTGINCGDLSHAVYEMIDRSVVVKTVVDGRILVSRPVMVPPVVMAPESPAGDDDDNDSPF